MQIAACDRPNWCRSRWAGTTVGGVSLGVGKDRIGRGFYTPNKYDDLRGLLNWHAGMCRGIISRTGAFYHFVDMNCGDGSGSPRISLETVRTHIRDARFFFCDDNAGNVLGTRSLWSNEPNVEIVCADNTVAVPDYLTRQKHKTSGIVYHDPNNAPDFDLIASLSRLPRVRYMDIVIYVSATNYKRVRRALGFLPYLADGMAKVAKAHWLVRSPLGANQWAFLIATNWNGFSEWKSHGYYRLETPEGQAIIDRLNLTETERAERYQIPMTSSVYSNYEEYLRTPEFAVARIAVMERADGLCEQCHIRPPTEPHHLSYPKWGSFDQPPYNNILALCHECHSKAHGKED